MKTHWTKLRVIDSLGREITDPVGRQTFLRLLYRGLWLRGYDISRYVAEPISHGDINWDGIETTCVSDMTS